MRAADKRGVCEGRGGGEGRSAGLDHAFPFASGRVCAGKSCVCVKGRSDSGEQCARGFPLFSFRESRHLRRADVFFFCGKRMIRAILALHSFYCLRNRCGICEAFGRTGLFRFLLARKARCSRRGARRIFIALLLASGWAVGGRGMIFSCCHAAEDGNGKS